MGSGDDPFTWRAGGKYLMYGNEGFQGRDIEVLYCCPLGHAS